MIPDKYLPAYTWALLGALLLGATALARRDYKKKEEEKNG